LTPGLEYVISMSVKPTRCFNVALGLADGNSTLGVSASAPEPSIKPRPIDRNTGSCLKFIIFPLSFRDVSYADAGSHSGILKILVLVGCKCCDRQVLQILNRDFGVKDYRY